MRYVLGLDLGIASIGWAIYNMDNSNIEKCGVRLFEPGEVKGARNNASASLSASRRLARGMRRRIRRRAYRMQKIKEHLINSGLVSKDELANMFNSTSKTKSGTSHYDVYELRYLALDSFLSNQQLARVLIHLAKHRGFKSNRKKDKSVDGTVNKSLVENRKLLEENGYRTVGEMLHKNQTFAANKRNRFGEYRVMLQRSDIGEEAKIILEAQYQLGNQLINQQFIEKYITMFNWQRDFAKAEDIQKMVGKCQFETEEARAPKACFSSEKFIALSKLNNLIVSNQITQEKRKLTPAEIQKIIAFILAKKVKFSPKIYFSNLRTILSLEKDEYFNFIQYKPNIKFNEQEQKEQIKELSFPATHELKWGICEHAGEVTWLNLFSNTTLLDTIAVELTYNKTDEAIQTALEKCFAKQKNNFDTDSQQAIISAILKDGVSFDKNISLSLKALHKIIPHLENGQRYDEACKSVWGHHSQRNQQPNPKLPSIQALGLDNELTNPVVIRAISQVRKVINAVIDNYGSPYQINIELARDIGKSVDQRNEISKRQKNNQANNERLIAEFEEDFGRKPMKDEFTKFKLWKQQGNKCIYSGEYINPENILHGTHATEIDHIIPHSRSFDDSMGNKVLCLTQENQRKGNQTPYEYIGQSGHNEQAWHKFEERCKLMNKTGYQLGFDFSKLDRLLLKKVDKEGFIERNLNDTRYIARFCKNYLENHLQFSYPEDNNKLRVRVLTGQATAFIRSHWGLSKSREENDLHHAQDACVIAAVTTKLVQNVTKYMHEKEFSAAPQIRFVDEDGVIHDRFPMPNINFRQQIIERVNKIFVSRMPKHKISGQVHLDTIRSRKYVDNPVGEYNNGKPFSTISKQLADSGIKLDKDGEIPTLCPAYKQHNPNIYRLLKGQLEKHGNDAKKAFAEPLYAPRKDGTPSEAQIKTIKIIQPQNTGVKVNQGIADNGGMVRIDIFNKEGKNYIVPVYLSEVIKAELPNRAIIANKGEADWEMIDSNFKFIFSLYPNDLVKITTKKETFFGYYTGTDRATGAITILLHDGSKEIRGIGIKINTLLEKFQVDVLGNITKVEKEKRLDFSQLQSQKR
ncbi:MAG: type II CRISPR RNA-guided endonuclease Cas9 [Neisseriaceae bacterium]|nr:MAG: type II CRISPR RNA-guided endonuclease Cas9 [Neisseriaceae bacterium]